MKSGIGQFASLAVLSLALAVQAATAADFGGAPAQGGQGQPPSQGRPSGGSNNGGHSGNPGNAGGGKFGSHEVPSGSGGGWQGRPPGGGNNGQWQGRPPGGGNNGQWQGHPPGNGNNNGQWQGRPPGGNGNDHGNGRPPGQNGNNGNQWQGGQGRPPGYGDSQWQNRPPANNGHGDGGKFGSHEVRPPPGNNWQGRPPPHGNWGPHPSYWRPGYVVSSMPPGHYRVPYRGSDYFFNDGYWYRPYGARYVVVTPPYGVRVRYLPSYAEQVWIGSIGYFLAAGTYYLWQASSQDYEVVAPPQQPQPVAVAQTGYDVIAYPMYNQGPDQQARDRYECHGWAVQQSGFDPASASYAPPAYVADNYRRALGACLSGRGYSIN
ncbi:hypothetical protein HNP46_005893 [Pseudomonas nitritireducens]|uniref:Glycine zipper family protein n=1 Tax=Pseudomonas nitroreducens TaxID=46680 RepID=A0A7W7KR08_PSENT|nr:DUF6515 family protein [Pseudomonas nitritireducens]MBB4866985.1 hypothetical protein [Pseudomonas nitritireducens]